MKPKTRFLFCTLMPMAAVAFLSTRAAADVIKADNTTALNLGGSYVGGVAPVSTDLLIIDGTLTVARTASLGDDLSVLGVSASSARTLTIGATTGKTLSIGTSGISKSGAGELTLNNATSLGGNISMPITGSGRINVGGALTLITNQTWGLGINRITVNNTINTGGNTLAITGGNGSIIAIYGANTLGSEVTISNGGNLWIGAPGAGVVTINGVNNTNASVSLFTGTLNIAAMGNLNGASSIGKSSLNIRAQTTLNYTGNTASSNKGMTRDTNSGLSLGDTTFNVTTAGQTLTMSGTFAHQGTSQTGAWIFGGAGNLTLTGSVQNGASTKVIKNGAGKLTLSGANTYASTTSVNSGTLALGANDTLPDTTDLSIGAATLDVATFLDAVGVLDVTDAASINLGKGGEVVFADSSAKAWLGSLNITGTFVSGTSLSFGPAGLTSAQLLKITSEGYSNFSLDGAGFLIATPDPGYHTWASLNGAGSKLDDDHDDDGVANGVEYFLGGPTGNTSGFTSLPSVTPGASRSVTWVKGSGYTGTYLTDFVVETSPDLAAGNWTAETLGGNVTISGNNVTYTFPTGSEKAFVRLKVTGP